MPPRSAPAIKKIAALDSKATYSPCRWVAVLKNTAPTLNGQENISQFIWQNKASKQLQGTESVESNDTSWLWLDTPIFRKMRLSWFRTVSLEVPSRSATCQTRSPAAQCAATLASAGVRPKASLNELTDVTSIVPTSFNITTTSELPTGKRRTVAAGWPFVAAMEKCGLILWVLIALRLANA